MTIIDDGWTLDYTESVTLKEYESLRETFAQKNEHVQFLDRNGYTENLEYARKHLYPKQILTVKECRIGGSYSEYVFVEFPNMSFNTVMFSKVKVDTL